MMLFAPIFSSAVGEQILTFKQGAQLRVERNFVPDYVTSRLYQDLLLEGIPTEVDDMETRALFDFKGDAGASVEQRSGASTDSTRKESVVLRIEHLKGSTYDRAKELINGVVPNRVLEEDGTIHLYVSSPSASALANHTDVTDFFVLQLEGAKDWFLCQEHGLKLDRRIHHKLDTCSTYSVQEIKDLHCEEVTLYAGDAMFLPRRVVHSARAPPDQSSAHLTFAFTGHQCSEYVFDKKQYVRDLQSTGGVDENPVVIVGLVFLGLFVVGGIVAVLFLCQIQKKASEPAKTSSAATKLQMVNVTASPSIEAPAVATRTDKEFPYGEPEVYEWTETGDEESHPANDVTKEEEVATLGFVERSSMSKGQVHPARPTRNGETPPSVPVHRAVVTPSPLNESDDDDIVSNPSASFLVQFGTVLRNEVCDSSDYSLNVGSVKTSRESGSTVDSEISRIELGSSSSSKCKNDEENSLTGMIASNSTEKVAEKETKGSGEDSLIRMISSNFGKEESITTREAQDPWARITI